MATTLSFGFILPQTGDKGSVWFPALENNIQQLNDHTHDGVISSKIGPDATTSQTQDLVAANWALLTTGTYRQLVTMPGSFQFEDQSMRFILQTAPFIGHEIYPSIEQVTANTFYVYINDNTLDLRVIYR